MRLSRRVMGTMLLRPVDNPKNPHVSMYAEWLEPPPVAKLEVFEETAKSILTRNDSPDIPFGWSINPYRGCQHACAYCYARPYHEYLGYGAGTDFDTKLVVKINAPELLERELRHPKWRGESICFSGITDCYQPLEAAYEITKQCLEVCLRARNGASIITKSFLVVRDARLLADLNRVASARVAISIPFADQQMAKLIEPQAPVPARRFEAIRRLCEAGVTVAVMMAPIIPGLNDEEIPEVLARAAEAGARYASYTSLRLSGSVRPVFLSRLQDAVPLKARRVIHRIQDMRDGQMNETKFGDRMRGKGVYWEAIRSLFEMHRKRLGFGDFSESPTNESEDGSEARGEPDAHLIDGRKQPKAGDSLVQLTFGFHG